MSPYSRVIATVGAASLFALTGCLFQSESSIALDPTDVETVELYFYAYPGDGSEVQRTTVDHPGLVAELVHAFTDMPMRSLGGLEDELPGSRAAGVRFILENGEQVDMTQVFVSHKNVAIFWPDGSVERTTWGVPLVDYYPVEGSELEEVAASEAPAATLP